MNAKYMKVLGVWMKRAGLNDEVEISASTTLNDLGADSLDMVELEMDLEREFDLKFDFDYDISGATTLGDIWSYIEPLLKEEKAPEDES